MAPKKDETLPEFLEGKDFKEVAALLEKHSQPLSIKGLTKLCQQQNVWCRVLRDSTKKIIAAMLYIVGKHEYRILRIVGSFALKTRLIRHLYRQLGEESGRFLIKIWLKLSETKFLMHLKRKKCVAQGIKGDFVCLWLSVEQDFS